MQLTVSPLLVSGLHVLGSIGALVGLMSCGGNVVFYEAGGAGGQSSIVASVISTSVGATSSHASGSGMISTAASTAEAASASSGTGGVGPICNVDGDCASNACDAYAHQCVADQCKDHHQDGGETDFDCGNGCPGCLFTQSCTVDGDCQSMACDGLSHTCVMDACADHQKDADESDVDCGGNGPCQRCPLGSSCATDADCTSQGCDLFTKTCVDPCTDHLQDFGESDLDCGGGTCVACALGQKCLLNFDCMSNACDAAMENCITDQCVDHHLDSQETDIDCGGPICSQRCPIGRKCLVPSDCALGSTCSISTPHVCS